MEYYTAFFFSVLKCGVRVRSVEHFGEKASSVEVLHTGHSVYFFSLLLKYLFHSNDKEINQRFKEKLGKIPMSKAFPTRMIHIPWLEWPLYCNPLLKSPEYSKM